jgi:YHS domain-containing protein
MEVKKMVRHANKQPFVDPVCGMSVDPATAAATLCHHGIRFYFCAEGCKRVFESNPDKFLSKKHKGFWQRYLERLNRATGGKPPACCH